jgi:hypothetical protein
LSYADDLRHPLWQRKRLHVLNRANWTCECCGSTTTELHAHHKVYVKGRKPWEYPDELLECLCDPCHEAAHAQLKRLELTVAEHPSAALPALNRVLTKVGEALTATNRAQRVDLLNGIQDELDAIEDYRRGAGIY